MISLFVVYEHTVYSSCTWSFENAKLSGVVSKANQTVKDCMLNVTGSLIIRLLKESENHPDLSAFIVQVLFCQVLVVNMCGCMCLYVCFTACYTVRK